MTWLGSLGSDPGFDMSALGSPTRRAPADANTAESGVRHSKGNRSGRQTFSGSPAVCEPTDVSPTRSSGIHSKGDHSCGRTFLAQGNFVPPPATLSGAWITATARKKEPQGIRKKRVAAFKKECKDACCKEGGRLNSLETILPSSLNAIRADGWEEVEMAVDSGASETVIGEDMVLTADLKESEGSRRGVEYKVANGESIPNLGEKRFSAWTNEGVGRNIKAQVCSVQQGLQSVKRLMDAGHRIVFEPDGSYIEDVSTYERMNLKEKNGMFFLQMWTKNSGRGF